MMIPITIIAFLLSITFSSALPPKVHSRSIVNNDCTCGYILTKYNNTYYPFSHRIDFSNEPDYQPTSAEGFEKYGLSITDGIGVGGSYKNVQSIGTFKNLRIYNGALELKVPGGQKLSTGLTAGEVTFAGVDGMTGGVFTVGVKIDPTVGTCQAVFMYHDSNDKGTVQDELDIEILSKAIFTKAADGTPPGVELTNFDPTDPKNERNDYTIVPFPADPTKAFHNYTIDWQKQQRYTYFDNKSLNSPKKYNAVNPSDLYINHWTDGDPDFTAGPPKTDTIMRVNHIEVWYKTASQSGLPKGCTLSKACKV